MESARAAPRPLSGRLVRTGAWTGVSCHEAVYDAGFGLTPHEHAWPFFGLALSGAFDETVGSRTLEFLQSSAVFHPAHEEHALSVRGVPLRAFLVEIDSIAIAERFGCEIACSNVRTNGELPSLLLALYREFRLGDSSTGLAIHGILLQLIAALSRAGEASCDSRPPFLARLDDFLRAHFASTLTLEEIARAVDAPPVRLSALFRATRGHSIADEQRRLRIEHACLQMAEASRPLAEIAEECGFADQPHFSRAFRRLKGMTPTQYRSVMR